MENYWDCEEIEETTTVFLTSYTKLFCELHWFENGEYVMEIKFRHFKEFNNHDTLLAFADKVEKELPNKIKEGEELDYFIQSPHWIEVRRECF